MNMRAKRTLALILSLSLGLLAFAGCSGAPAAAPGESEAPAAPASSAGEEPAPEEAAPAAADKVLLVTSFGTSYNDNRDLSIGSIEQKLQAAYPDYEIRRAFTSQIIIDKLKKRDGIAIDNVTEAMDRLVSDGVREVVVQPTHVMSGFEYDDVVAEVTPYADKFDSFKIGSPLLVSDADYDEVVSIITGETKDYDAEGTAVVFMGHGTEHEANATYAKLQQHLTAAGYGNYFIGTVEATPSLDDVLALVQDSGAKKVVLLPLMIVAGDHANNDMAGDEEGSWKTTFEQAGFEVECVLRGLGQYEEIQNMFVEPGGARNAQKPRSRAGRGLPRPAKKTPKPAGRGFWRFSFLGTARRILTSARLPGKIAIAGNSPAFTRGIEKGVSPDEKDWNDSAGRAGGLHPLFRLRGRGAARRKPDVRASRVLGERASRFPAGSLRKRAGRPRGGGPRAGLCRPDSGGDLPDRGVLKLLHVPDRRRTAHRGGRGDVRGADAWRQGL